MKKIGVLALQGSVQEHLNMLNKIPGVAPVPVKRIKELESIDKLIIPGGESTAIGRLLRDCSLLEPLSKAIKEGMPVWGTCAGMIILAKEIEGTTEGHLRLMDITVKRNAYGGQLESFVAYRIIPEIYDKEMALVFIRAPYITRAGKGVSALLELDGRIVAAKQDNMLVTSFHPELTSKTHFHSYFCNGF